MRSLNQLLKTDHIFNGSKAANLGEAIHEGFTVPLGITLSYSYFNEFLLENNINYLPDQYMEKGLQLQAKIMESKLNPDKRRELGDQLLRLKQESGCNYFVVRSSSSVEDSNNYSMAGLFESYLKLKTLDEVEGAIKKVYASLYHDRVLNYLYENNISFNKLKMGVIIQAYIEGEAQGVLFTADTINMQEDQLQVSLRTGDCEQEQEKSAAIYSMNKATGAITSMYGAESLCLISEDLSRKLLSLALSVERVFGKNQDIEWVYKDQILYLLQVRPITTFKGTALNPTWDNPQQEQYDWYGIFEQPCKPLMQDIMKADMKHQSEGALETLFRTDTHVECIVLSGYLYVRSIPIQEEGIKREAYLNKLKELAAQGICIYHDKILPTILEYTDRLKQYIGNQLDHKELISFLELSMEYLTYCSRQHWPAVQANEFLYEFEKEFLSSYPDKDLEDFCDLVSGSTLLTRERQLLIEMANEVKRNKELSDLFETCSYDTVLYERLKTHTGAKHLFELFQTYINEYGVCTGLGSENLLPTVLERPYYIISNMRSVLGVDEEQFLKNIRDTAKKKEAIRQDILARLKGAEQEEFLRKAALAEKAFLANDNHNYYVEKQYYGYIRLAVMEAGAYLVKEDVLKTQEDIFYLHLKEIVELLEGALLNPELINNRKAEYEMQRQIAAPEILCKTSHPSEQEELQGSPTCSEPKSDKREAEVVLKGVSGLKKNTRGIIYNGLPSKLEDEMILVLPHCHAGDIMPIISKVKGLIFQWGTPYDHPAIIARELGIPAIYFVNEALSLLETGDEVELDGFRGEVTILRKGMCQ